MKSISILLISLFVVTLSLAVEAAVRKYRNYTPQQIQNIPEKERSSTLPIMYILAAQRGVSVGSELLFGSELNRLRYPGLHDYKAAVKAFQTDLGDEPTGVLTVWQIHNLQQRSEMQGLSRVLFPNQFSSFKTDDYASIEGTMMIIDEKAAWPINHTKVKCFKNENYCALDQIVLIPPDLGAQHQMVRHVTRRPVVQKLSLIVRFEKSIFPGALTYSLTGFKNECFWLAYLRTTKPQVNRISQDWVESANVQFSVDQGYFSNFGNAGFI